MVTRAARPVAAGWSGPGWLVWLLSTPVIGSAVILSFAGLAELARVCRIDGWLVYLWPVSLDATGVVSTLIWLDRRAPADARRAARLLALASIGLSIGGNSLWHWLVANGYQPEVWVQMAVGAVPPMVLAATLHVLQLAARRQDRPDHRAGRPTGPVAGMAGRVVVATAAPARPLAVVEMPVVTVVGQPVDRPAPADQPDPASQPVPTDQPDPASQPGPADQPDQPVHPPAERLAVIHPPAGQHGQRGAWRFLINTARPIVADQPGIGRHALAQALAVRLGRDVPTSQARKVLDHLAAEPGRPTGQTDLLATDPTPAKEPARV